MIILEIWNLFINVNYYSQCLFMKGRIIEIYTWSKIIRLCIYDHKLFVGVDDGVNVFFFFGKGMNFFLNLY